VRVRARRAGLVGRLRFSRVDRVSRLGWGWYSKSVGLYVAIFGDCNGLCDVAWYGSSSWDAHRDCLGDGGRAVLGLGVSTG
jgi:hypothetical protein